MPITSSFRKILLFIFLLTALSYIHSLFWVNDAFLAKRQAQADSLYREIMAKPFKKNRPKGKVSINRALAEELRTLPRIGAKMAERIIEYRNRNPYKSLEELKNVKGIGEKTFLNLKDMITL
jgi:competence ComEA-like helix-hairpin-helix protein